MDSSALIGSWKMQAWTRQSVATGEITDALGPEPIGYIAYHADGRMMATVFRRDRPAPQHDAWPDTQKARLFDDMLAYVASYTLEGNRVVHHVDGSWNPNWQGDLSRPFTLEGDRLVISGAPGLDPATGEEVVYRMEFIKVSASQL
ncbi:MAG: lipocalin-like domain-containing protein [Pseudomonadota bacterium]